MFALFGELLSTRVNRLFHATDPAFWDPIWAVALIGPEWAGPVTVAFIIIGLLGCGAAGLNGGSNRLIRISAAAWFFLAEACVYSAGKIDHGHHVILFGLIALCCLPSSEASSAGSVDQQDRVMLGLQLLVGLVYSLSGAAKIATGVYDLASGHPGFFSLDAARYYAAAAIVEQSIVPLAAPFVKTYGGWWASVLLWLAACTEASGLLIAAYAPFVVRRAWAFAIVGMHVGIALTIGPNFALHAAAVWLLFGYYRSSD